MILYKSHGSHRNHGFFRNVNLAIGFLVLVAVLTVGVGLATLAYSRVILGDYWRGRANQPGDFLLMVVGDSAAQGIGASQPKNSFVGLLAARIGQTTGRSVRVINLGTAGATVHGALASQAPWLAKVDADLVVLEIGANDMKHYDGSTNSAFAADYERLLQMLPPNKSVAVDMPVFGGRKNLTRRSEAANQVIHKLAATYRIPVAPLYDTLKQRQSPWIYASDFFHPNDRGYRIWYDAIWQASGPLVTNSADNQKASLQYLL